MIFLDLQLLYYLTSINQEQIQTIDGEGRQRLLGVNIFKLPVFCGGKGRHCSYIPFNLDTQPSTYRIELRIEIEALSQSGNGYILDTKTT